MVRETVWTKHDFGIHNSYWSKDNEGPSSSHTCYTFSSDVTAVPSMFGRLDNTGGPRSPENFLISTPEEQSQDQQTWHWSNYKELWQSNLAKWWNSRFLQLYVRVNTTTVITAIREHVAVTPRAIMGYQWQSIFNSGRFSYLITEQKISILVRKNAFLSLKKYRFPFSVHTFPYATKSMCVC